MTPRTTGTPPGTPPYPQRDGKSQKRNSGFAVCATGRPLRRDLLTGWSAGPILPENATQSVAECIAAWKEAAQVHLEAKHRYAAASEAVEEEQEFLPAVGPLPEMPRPFLARMHVPGIRPVHPRQRRAQAVLMARERE